MKLEVFLSGAQQVHACKICLGSPLVGVLYAKLLYAVAQHLAISSIQLVARYIRLDCRISAERHHAVRLSIHVQAFKTELRNAGKSIGKQYFLFVVKTPVQKTYFTSLRHFKPNTL